MFGQQTVWRKTAHGLSKAAQQRRDKALQETRCAESACVTALAPERILTRLRAEGYAFSTDYEGADAVIVNTCGFLDSAKAESLDAIGEALRENGKVIVTGCLGAEAETISEAHPSVLAITGPQQYEQVMDAVHSVTPPRSPICCPHQKTACA